MIHRPHQAREKTQSLQQVYSSTVLVWHQRHAATQSPQSPQTPAFWTNLSLQQVVTTMIANAQSIQVHQTAPSGSTADLNQSDWTQMLLVASRNSTCTNDQKLVWAGTILRRRLHLSPPQQTWNPKCRGCKHIDMLGAFTWLFSVCACWIFSLYPNQSSSTSLLVNMLFFVWNKQKTYKDIRCGIFTFLPVRPIVYIWAWRSQLSGSMYFIGNSY